MMLTIAIITRKRPEFLYECLASIYRQTTKDFGVLVIDNDRDKTAQPVYEHYWVIKVLPIAYVHEPVPGYSNARNCALNNCNTQFIGFVDDDCVLDKNWVEQGMAAINRCRSAFIVGRSIESQSEKLFAVVEKYFIYDIMPVNFYDKETHEIRHEKLDTKNLILDNHLLKAHNVYFDNRFNLRGGEDVDLGLQIKYKNLKGHYNENMVVYHKEKTTYKKFINKAFNYGYSGYNLYHKWHNANECRGWANYTWFRFWNIISWKHSLVYSLVKLKHRNLFRIAYFLFLTRMFFHTFLKGALESKKFFREFKTAGMKSGNVFNALKTTDKLPMK